MQVQICTPFKIVYHGNKEGSAMSGPSSSELVPKITSYTGIINFDALIAHQVLSLAARIFASRIWQT